MTRNNNNYDLYSLEINYSQPFQLQPFCVKTLQSLSDMIFFLNPTLEKMHLQTNSVLLIPKNP